MRKFLTEIIMFVFGLLFFVTSFGITEKGFKGDVLNQRSYVLILAVLLMFSALGSIIVQYLRNRNAQEGKRPQSVANESEADEVHSEQAEPKSKNKNLNIYISMILLVLFAYGFSYIGFFVTSFLFVFISTWMYSNWDKKLWARYLLFSAVLNLVLYFLFDIVHVYFPDTLLF